MPDHIHLIVSAPPSISPSELVKHLKGHTARRLGEEYPWLRRRSHIWARGYWVSTLGDVSIVKALNYVLSQGKPKALNGDSVFLYSWWGRLESEASENNRGGT